MLNSGRHLCSAGRPSGWALAHILVSFYFMAALLNREFLWPSCVIRQAIIFMPWFLLRSFFYLSFFPRLILAVVDWMSVILPHLVWQQQYLLHMWRRYCYGELRPTSLLSFPRLISAVGDWMSTILPHMMWPYYGRPM